MKSSILKLFALTVILSTFALQGFTPPLPNYTTVKITNLEWTDQFGDKHDYYAAKVTVWGPSVEYPSGTESTIITVSLPRNTEYFMADYQAYWTTTSDPTGISVSVKVTSTSSWQFLGSTSTMSPWVYRTMTTGDYLYFIEFSASILQNAE